MRALLTPGGLGRVPPGRRLRCLPAGRSPGRAGRGPRVLRWLPALRRRDVRRCRGGACLGQVGVVRLGALWAVGFSGLRGEGLVVLRPTVPVPEPLPVLSRGVGVPPGGLLTHGCYFMGWAITAFTAPARRPFSQMVRAGH